MIIRELITRLGFQMDDAEARRYQTRLKNLGTVARRVGRSLSLFVTAPIVALGGSFIKVAADAEETESKFKEVFSSITDEANATAAALSKDFDLATSSAQEMLSTTGDILVGFGFTEKAALDLSQQVNSLAVDIASFKNVQGGAAQASNAITKALLGEREMLKGIGIAILEEDVKIKLAQLTAEGMTFATNRQAKSFATLQLVIDRSTKSIGDYARTSQSATNQSRKLRQRWIELSVTLGKVLLPLFTDLVKALSSVIEWLNSFSPAGRKAIVIIAGIVAALGPLLIVIGAIVFLVSSIPLLVALAIAAVAALALLIGEDINAFLSGRKSVFGLIFNASKEMFIKIFDYLGELWDGWIKRNVEPWIKRVESLAATVGVSKAAVRPTLGALGQAALMAVPGLGSPSGAFEALRNLRQPEAAGGVTVNMDMTLHGVSAETAGSVGQETADAVQRAFAEAKSRAATTPRLAP